MRRNAALFVAISLLSGFGSTAMSLVAGIWILDLTGSTSLAGLAGLCVYAPTLAAPWLGAVVDRLPRRPLVITVNLLLSALLLTLFTVHSRTATWVIFAVMLGYGISYVLLDAGETALLPAAIPASGLGDVNGWRSSAQEGMKLIAPVAGAALYAWHGGGSVAAVSALMPLVVAVLYGRLELMRPAVRRRRDGRAGFARVDGDSAGWGVRAGLVVLWGQRAVRIPVIVAGTAIAMSGFTTAAIYAAVTERLGLPSTFIGVLGSAQGAGSIAGGLFAGRLIAKLDPTMVGPVGAALFAAGCVCRCLPWSAALIVGSLLIGVGLPWTLIAGVTAVQKYTPDALLGRVAGTANAAMFGPNALAIPLGAAAVHLGSVPPHLIAAGICLTAATLALSTHRAELLDAS